MTMLLADHDLDPETLEELEDLYAQLHMTCDRAATALRLAGKSAEPADLLARFQQEEARAKAIWQRIAEIQGF
jgi:hypothetical protein